MKNQLSNQSAAKCDVFWRPYISDGTNHGIVFDAYIVKVNDIFMFTHLIFNWK